MSVRGPVRMPDIIVTDETHWWNEDEQRFMPNYRASFAGVRAGGGFGASPTSAVKVLLSMCDELSLEPAPLRDEPPQQTERPYRLMESRW